MPPDSRVPKRDAVYRSPTLGDSVVQMLHHMGRIFEDNSKADGTLYGLRIDRKRRRELQRKRLAMGHKPADHEEISHTSVQSRGIGDDRVLRLCDQLCSSFGMLTLTPLTSTPSSAGMSRYLRPPIMRASMR